MADPQDKEPAEGSREVIDKELRRQDAGKKGSGRDGDSKPGKQGDRS